jgi:hypothetical protein
VAARPHAEREEYIPNATLIDSLVLRRAHVVFVDTHIRTLSGRTVVSFDYVPTCNDIDFLSLCEGM